MFHYPIPELFGIVLLPCIPCVHVYSTNDRTELFTCPSTDFGDSGSKPHKYIYIVRYSISTKQSDRSTLLKKYETNKQSRTHIVRVLSGLLMVLILRGFINFPGIITLENSGNINKMHRESDRDMYTQYIDNILGYYRFIRWHGKTLFFPWISPFP